MILIWLIGIPIIAGMLAWAAARWRDDLARWVSLAALIVEFILVLRIWVRHAGQVNLSGRFAWLVEVSWVWIPNGVSTSIWPWMD